MRITDLKKVKKLVDEFVDSFVTNALKKVDGRRSLSDHTFDKSLLDYLLDANAGKSHLCGYILFMKSRLRT